MNPGKISLRIIISAICFLILSAEFVAQQENKFISSAEKKEVVDSVALFMENYYVFPDKGKEIADYIKNRFEDDEYEEINDPLEFSGKITKDLRAINNDRHISLIYAPDMIKRIKESQAAKNDDFDKYELELSRKRNFGFEEVKILDGNIGYLKLNSFDDAGEAGETAIAAMNFFAYADAIIFDLRNNGGGSPSMIQLISSYLFDEPVHLNSFYIRKGERTKQFWTQANVTGRKMTNADVYVLTSGYTFSAAEEFTYNLKNMERATIIGETTGGGAHPVSGYYVNDNFRVIIPFGKAVNPVTKSNWEGTGITPHVEVSRDKALITAHIKALEKLKEKENDERIIAKYQWALEGLYAKENPVEIDKEILVSYAGDYSPRKITFEDGKLYYQREGRPKYRMIPIKKDLFGFEELSYFRLKIIKENNKVVAVEGHYDNGKTDRNEKK